VELDVPALFEDHYDPIASYLMRRQVDRSTAQEIAAATFEQAWTCREKYDPGKGDPRAWLFGIAINLMRRHFRTEHRRLRAYARAASRRVDAHEDWDEICGRLDVGASAGLLAAALATLAPRDYEVLTLRYWTELSHEEIAIAVGIPAGTVKSRLNRALSQVRAQLDPADVEAKDG
jgi:RNA polymerase sigma-70 factor (ECF subfamily)